MRTIKVIVTLQALFLGLGTGIAAGEMYPKLDGSQIAYVALLQLYVCIDVAWRMSKHVGKGDQPRNEGYHVLLSDVAAIGKHRQPSERGDGR